MTESQQELCKAFQDNVEDLSAQLSMPSAQFKESQSVVNTDSTQNFKWLYSNVFKPECWDKYYEDHKQIIINKNT